MENKKNDRWYILGCLAALLILVIIDQWSKELAVHGLKDRDTIVLIPGVFELFYLENRGAAFGIFENMRWMFLLGTGLILVLAVFLFRRFPKKRKYLPFFISLTMIAAGGIGNLIDRLRLGYVIDFFYFSLIDFRGYVVDFIYFSLIDFPVFNVADIYVTVGVALFAILYLITGEEELSCLSGKK